MTEPIPFAASENPTTPSVPVELVTTGNLAAAQCARVYEQTRKAELDNGATVTEARDKAAQQYRTAMPVPSGRKGIRDFIACVAHGVLIGAITPRESTALLYAAQVAQSTLRESEPPKPKRF